ncbi:MAG TPA: alpha-mannosidase [Candidatus Caccalectryoclostridium excrementigallinarum]|uniref:Alpha-mannosidase n=1 Tax=Candidatus Caccalectryoclostridium excrementigallinarum TaxID=2840710 RepID=A0A9D1MMX2_9FIRM|nr:alpha-mannosidase [Candidatus Caccalectryoclostridium excrementigallinarum]
MGNDKNFVLKAIANGSHAFNLIALKGKIYKKIASLKPQGILSDEPIKWEDLDKSKFKNMRFMQKWADKFGCAWFRFTGTVPEAGKGKRVVARIKLQGEGLVYDKDGHVLQGITQVLSKGDLFHSTIGKQIVDISPCAEGGEEVELYVDAGFNGKLRFENMSAHLRRYDLAVMNEELNSYYYDYIEAYFLMCKLLGDAEGMKDSDVGKAEVYSARAKELDEGMKNAWKVFKEQGAAKAREALAPVLFRPIDYPAVTHYAVGHAHIDLAWLWPLRETRRKIGRTFANQLRNIKKYDNFIFAESQAQMFTWLKEDYPEVFEQVKKYVAEGRIELQGGMWVESDCNLPSGESWIRQFLYGKRYFKEEFGKDMKMCWLPDCFGFPATLPQVIKGCGMDYFMTIKIMSNTVNEFPHSSFKWKGLDGSEVLAHMEPAGDYNSGASPLAIFKSNKRNKEKESVPVCLLLYGDGDGGGGPGEGHIEYVSRMQKGIYGLAPVKPSKAIDFFEELEKYNDVIPEYDGELYYERHQGTYTSQAAAKLWNRRMENMLHLVELLGAEGKLRGVSYDRALVESIWKEVLLYQFHDVLPGSSIKRVYDESRERYKELYKQIQGVAAKLIDDMSSGESEEYTAINPVDFARKEFIRVEDKWYSVDLPAMGAGKIAPVENMDVSSLTFGENTISNGLITITFGKGGEITSLFDVKNAKELVREGQYFNKLTVYEDPFMYYNAWDIRMDYDKLKKHSLKLEGSDTYIDGVRVVRRNRYRFMDSQFEQTVALTLGDTLVQFDMDADWHEELKMLRADFIPSVFADKVKCDIQFGQIDRSTKNDTSIEQAQFEVCAHKFVNLDGEDYSLALFNRCKYGHKVKEGMLSLALLRAPRFPDPECDRGSHHISYALYPHKEKFEESDVKARAYCYNNVVMLRKANFEEKCPVGVEGDGVILETVKVAEDEKGIVARLYEYKGKETKAKVSFASKGAAFECDMLENKKGKAELSKLAFKPFEIKTLYFEL